MCSVTCLKNATQVLARLPRNLAARVVEKIEEVAADPYGGHPNVAKLKGREGYRLRVGDWRIIYDLDNKKTASDGDGRQIARTGVSTMSETRITHAQPCTDQGLPRR